MSEFQIYQPVDRIEVIFAFFVFALFFATLYYCHYTNERIKNNHKKSTQNYYPSPTSVGYTKPIISLNHSKKLENVTKICDDKSNEQCSYFATVSKPDTRGSLLLSKIQDKENEHEMNVYRSRIDIKNEREDFISRSKVIPPSTIPATKITPPKETKTEPLINNKANANETNKNEISSNVLDPNSKEQKKTLHKTPSFSNLKDIGKSNSNKISEENTNPSPNFTNNNLTKNLQTKENLGLPSNPIFNTSLNQETKNIEPKETIFKPTIFTPVLPPVQPSISPETNIKPTVPATVPPTVISFPPINPTNPSISTSPINPIVTPPVPSVTFEKSTEPTPIPNITKKINTSLEYLESIINYSKTFAVKTEIRTIISNLGGAKSDPRELWDFTSNYIKTINPNDHEQAVTFSYRIWEAIVHKFIKNTNIKDGFEKMPPKEKSKQVEKNSINTYIILVNIFRMMGHETIWLGVYGNTLRMLEFLFKRKEIIKGWKELDLVERKYVAMEGDISAKYHSRIDFLIYLLLGLTTFDPILVLEEVSEKTGEAYPFLTDLKKMKNKWSYNEFWCMVESMRNNKLEAYFKIPFWNNVLTVIYPQMLAHQQSQQINSTEEPVMKEFMALSKWIFKEVKNITKKLETSPEGRALNDIEDEGRDGKNSYQFDGEEFIGGIKTLGRAIDTREREMRTTRWQEFRDKCSIFYYLWRQDSS